MRACETARSWCLKFSSRAIAAHLEAVVAVCDLPHRGERKRAAHVRPARHAPHIWLLLHPPHVNKDFSRPVSSDQLRELNVFDSCSNGLCLGTPSQHTRAGTWLNLGMRDCLDQSMVHVTLETSTAGSRVGLGVCEGQALMVAGSGAKCVNQQRRSKGAHHCACRPRQRGEPPST